MKILSILRNGANQLYIYTSKGLRLLTAKDSISSYDEVNLMKNAQKYGFRQGCKGIGKLTIFRY